MGLTLTIAGSVNTDLRVRCIKASYVQAWEAELFYPGRHDAALSVRLWDTVLITDETETVRFSGHVTVIKPGGVQGEGIVVMAQDGRFRLENEPVRINGRGFYVWNQRGSTCDYGQGGYDDPDRDGMHWTCGQIVIDILEHALGVPLAGSGIPGHHTSACCVPDPYLTSGDVAGYTASDILALDSICGEFSVDNTPVAQAIGLLLGLNGGFYGWYIDPTTGYLVVADMDSLPTTNVEAGELGQWQDRTGHDYRLLDNQLEFSLDGVVSTIIIQGLDTTSEEQPANIEGSGNPGKGNLGLLEMVAAPWLGWPAAWRAKCQPTRLVTARPIDQGTPPPPPNLVYWFGLAPPYWQFMPGPDGDKYSPPADGCGCSYLPRVYVGSEMGPKQAYCPPSGFLPTFNVVSGIIIFAEDPRGVMGPYDELWLWYFASVPFTVTAGPSGDAYECYGYKCARTVYDATMRDVDSYPSAAFSSADKDAMGVLAARLLTQYCDVRRQGNLELDGVDFGDDLGSRYNVTNLTAPAGGLPCGAGPMNWSSLAINAVEVTWNFAETKTEIRVANTFFMLAEYSALKTALEQQLFVQREQNLSQTILDCQVNASAIHSATTSAGYATTWPPDATHGPTTPPLATTAPPATTGTATTGAATTGAPTTGAPTTAGETTAGETTAGETTAGETTAGETTGGETTSGETTSGETTGAEATSGGPTTSAEPCPDVPSAICCTEYQADTGAFSGSYIIDVGGTCRSVYSPNFGVSVEWGIVDNVYQVQSHSDYSDVGCGASFGTLECVPIFDDEENFLFSQWQFSVSATAMGGSFGCGATYIKKIQTDDKCPSGTYTKLDEPPVTYPPCPTPIRVCNLPATIDVYEAGDCASTTLAPTSTASE